MRRHGAVELLVVLPDGSKTLIPADFTDAVAAVAEPGTATVGSVEDLVGLTVVVGSLLALSSSASAVGGVVDAAGIPPGRTWVNPTSRLAVDLVEGAATAAPMIDRSPDDRPDQDRAPGGAEVGFPDRRLRRGGRAG
jgi:hypothetical protein